MRKIISVANQKGGVGKTTTTLNLAAGLVKKGKKTLASISAKATQISSASYFLLVCMMRMLLPEEERDEVDELAAKARKLGIEYLKLRDKDIDTFIRSGIERIKIDSY